MFTCRNKFMIPTTKIPIWIKSEYVTMCITSSLQDRRRLSEAWPPPAKGGANRRQSSAWGYYSILCRNWQDVGRPCGGAGTALAVTERAGGRGTRKGYAASVRLLRRQRLRKGPPLRRVTVDGAQHQPPLLKADSPCQGEMSRRDKRDRARWHGEAVTEGFTRRGMGAVL